MRAAVTLHLALCAALTLRAPTHCQIHENLPDNETQLHCDEDSPTIGVTNYYNDTSDYQYSNMVYNSAIKLKRNVSVPFGTSVNVWCSGSSIVVAKRLTMTRDGQILPTKKYPDTIVWSTGKLDSLKSEYEYVCTDVETKCKRSVITLVTPGLEVISETIHISVDNGHTTYIVQYEKSMTVLCSGPNAARLVMSLHGEPLPTERESDTAIKHFERQPLDLQTSEFTCTDVFTTYNRRVTVRVVPTVYFQSENETLTPYYTYFDKWNDDSFVYYIDYSDSIEVYCSGSQAVKLIEHGDENKFSTENCNLTTVKFMKKLKLGQSQFHCTGCEVADYVNKVRVIITPRIELRSSNVLRVGNWQHVAQYAIKYGTDLEIICSETDSAQLRIRYKYSEDCAEQIVNETAIKCVVKELKREDEMFIDCYRLSDSFGDEPARVRVGVLSADVVDFHCVSHRVLYLNCSWTAPNLRVTFTLSYVENGIFDHVCEKRSSPEHTKFCIWDYGYDSKQVETEVFTFILKSCNKFGCFNQTFHIDHASVVKPAPPRSLKVLNTTAREAVLQWAGDLHRYQRVAGEYFYLDTNNLQYKVQYWYSGIEPRDVNSSLVTCDYDFCIIELILPCPGHFYQVWIYQKPKRVVGDEFWSDPNSVFFHTGAVENDKIDDPTCSWKPRKTPEVMTYLVQERKQDVHRDMQPMKEKVRSLKAKLAAIQTYLEQRGKGTR